MRIHTHAKQAAGTDGILMRELVPREGDVSVEFARSRLMDWELGEAECDDGSVSVLMPANGRCGGDGIWLTAEGYQS